MAPEEKAEMTPEESFNKFPFLKKLDSSDLKCLIMALISFVLIKDVSIMEAIKILLEIKEDK